MSIRILFFATLRDITGMDETSVKAAGFTDINSIFNKFAKDFPALENYRSTILFARNSEFAQAESPIQDGDELAFFPPVSGG
jgi:molybdopterin synthase sulfur carrier subunit